MSVGPCLKTKMVFVVLIALLLVSSTGFTDNENCFHCGMFKSEFGHSWMIIENENDQQVGVCSIHCAAIDMVLNKDTLVKRITVGDFHTKKQIDAYRAYWVLGGDLPGVMTSRAKWAFEKKESADGFIKKHGGRSAVFEEVIRAAFEDLYEDTMAIKRKRKMIKMEKQNNLE